MLTIGKIGTARPSRTTTRNRSPSPERTTTWARVRLPESGGAAGADMLGVGGVANQEQLRNLFAGRHPETGEQLPSTKGNVKVHGLDLTFSAPKSLGVIYALG